MLPILYLDLLKGLRYRLYPTEDQKCLLDKHINGCRFVYNLGLQIKSEAYKYSEVNISIYELMKQLPGLKEVCPWLSEVNAQSLQQSLRNLDDAYKRFFKGEGFPNYKSKKSGGSFCIPQFVKVKDNKIILRKFKEGIDILLHRPLIGEIKKCTVVKTPTGKYFASILVEDGKELPTPPPIQVEKSIGIDTGIKSFAVTSDGRTYEANRKYKESLDRLQVLQRRASKKKLGSKNRKKANLKVARLHEKIVNQRHDYIHKVTTDLTSDNQAVSTIFVEDLNVAGMLKNHKLAQAVSDISLSKFYEILGYKCQWKGINLIKIGRFDPSSKRCNTCGEINQELTLKDRAWTCECGVTHDRDENAAKNILWYGMEQYLKDKTGAVRSEEPVEEPTLVGPVKQEALQE